MNAYVNPLRLAVMFDGDQSDIQGMAQDAVGQLAETAQGLGRSLIVKGAQTMDAEQRGGVVNWSNWIPASEFGNERIQFASCWRSNNVVLGALHPLAIENEILSIVDPLSHQPRFVPEKIDAVLIATGRSQADMSKELHDMFQLGQILNGKEADKITGIGRNPLAFRPESEAHRGLVKQGTRVFSLATILGVEDILQEKLSAPTSGMSFYGQSGEIKQLVDAMAVTLADPNGARQRLTGNRFAQLLLKSENV